MKKLLSMLAIMVFAALQTFGQRTITGTVTSSEDGSTLPGVTVTVKGMSGSGTITDFNGAYSLSVPEGEQTLVFSFVGMKTKEVITAQSTKIDVVLDPEAVQVGDVVVTAMGISRDKKALGYAVQEVSGDAISKVAETNVVNSLSGRVAGVQVTASSGAVGSSARVVLRGGTSITGSNEPLWVVDGVPINNGNYGSATSGGGFDMPNGAADINPDDIESMSILKGANAAALYGSRAANGVILVKTKSGRTKKGLGVSVNSTTTFEKPLILPAFQNSYGQGASDVFFEFVDGEHGSEGVDESWGMPLDVGLQAVQFTSYKDGLKPEPWVSHPNNIRDFYEQGMTMTNNVALSGGNDKNAFRLSVSDSRQKGIVPNTNFNKSTISGSAMMNLTDKLSSEFSVNYVKSLSDNLPTGGYNNENPVQQMIWSGRQVDFNYLKDYENLPLLTTAKSPNVGTPLNWNTLFQNNPYWVQHNNLNQLDKDRVIGNVKVAYKFNDWLSVQGRAGSDYWASVVKQKKAKSSNENPEGFYEEISRTWYETNMDAMLMFKKDFNDVTTAFNVGGNMMNQVSNRITGTAPQLELVGVYNLSNVKSGVNATLSNYYQQRKVNSIFFNGQVGYKGLFLEFTGRNDWSSVLPVNNNSFFYPSVSLSAVITEMLGIQSNILSYAKVRGSWAQVGGDGALTPYKLQQSFSFRATPWGNVLLPFNGTTLNNPNLKSETTTSMEFGIDTRLFANRVRFDVTYYNSTSKDLLVPVQVSASTGYNFAWDNVGEINNKGIELQLGVDVIKTDDFNWTINANWAKFNNKVVSLGGLESLNLGGQWNMTLQAREGEPYGVIYGSAFKRSPEGEIIYENGVPIIDETQKILGNIQADWTGGLGTSLSFKGIELSAHMDAKMGGNLHSMTTTWGRYAGVLNETLEGRETGVVGKGVKEDPNNPGKYIPNDVVVTAEAFNKGAYTNDVVESAVFDASYVKLRQVALGYTIPNKIMGKFPLRDISLSVVGRNLAVLYSKIPHVDPESAFSSENGEQGQEFGQLPSTRSVGFNINFKF